MAVRATSTKLSSCSTFSLAESLKFHLRFDCVSNIWRPFSTRSMASRDERERKWSSSSLLSAKLKAKSKASVDLVKRRTRSAKEFNEEYMKRYSGNKESHIPVMLGEVMDAFSSSSSFSLQSFVDCTLGAAGHSFAIIQAHPELQLYIGLDVDPIAHKNARTLINELMLGDSSLRTADLKAYTQVRNFKEIKQVIGEVDNKLLASGVDGILMDLGMSSMQVDNAERGFSMLSNGPLDMRMDPRATLKAEDIVNSWPADEVGRILRDYGEETSWYSLQNAIVKARLQGGLHSADELVEIIRITTSRSRGGRQGWIKTSARVFQALRIAVNDELRTLEDSLRACFDCLAPRGRLAVVSFHSLEDRIVKQTFLSLINGSQGRGENDGRRSELRNLNNNFEKDAWIKQIVEGDTGIVLTKRPITASAEEERLNSRSRSAKLRVIQKI
ncbi:hypothetical protein Nepgr_012578 [Nepenthes gracilis]|uniref:Ribosomal RNA small subunit methyltransferase H n=1 Tax=Nepenthes gracilis TaxID=150966 RepID=A0AAD3XMX4_NEPGR|nr:hypothetical protein Nepgr_012578 [Nepenthes gracilis]